MEEVKIFDKKDELLNWDYDEEADTLYLSFGKPRPAEGIDIGKGVIIRYDESKHEVVGLTIIGVARGVEEHISNASIKNNKL